MREIVLDTETTGLSVENGHRIVEIGCIELNDQILTSNRFHCYLNPQRKVSEEAFKVHGYSDEFLSDKKKFSEIVDDFLQFIKNKKLIIPNHIAIIMDGNGRWAKKQSMLRLDGHKKGVDAVRKITRFCGEIGVKKLTLYTFSSENWKRPKTEIRGLMILLLKTIEKEISNLNKNNVRFTTIGELGKMPLDVSNMLRDGVNLTSNNDGLNLNLAVNYGGRQEITSICQEIADEVKNQKININDVTESYVNQKFALDNYYEPDLLIRTGGEFRISNFMLWQLAYSEIFVTKIFWPDFNEDALMESIINYNNRERRFGKISEQI